MPTPINEAQELLEALDPDQRQIARQVHGPLAVLAGAGTGKTRAITYRIAYGVAAGAYSQSSILAVTFTARAAAEMRERLRILGVPGVQAKTFHAAALKQLSYFWPTGFGGTMPPLLEHKASLVASAAARCNIKADRATVRDIAAEIEWAKVNIIDAQRYTERARSQGRTPPVGLKYDQVSRLLGAYEDAKMDRGAIDFEDVLIYMCGLLETREDIARVVRDQYRYFVVDEYQDVSRLQQRLLDLWVGDRNDVCVVGDIAQTIYSFAGASSQYLVEFQQRYAGAKKLELTRDYRSTPQIVAVANCLMGTQPNSKGKVDARRLLSDEGASQKTVDSRGEQHAKAVHLVSQRESGQAVAMRTYNSDLLEARGIVNRIKHLVSQGTRLRSIAILYRTNSQSETFEKALSDASIPFNVKGGKRFFDREEIRRAMLVLRRGATWESHDSHQGEDVENNFDGSEKDGQNMRTLPKTVEQLLGEVGWTPDPPEVAGAVRERWDNLNALVELAGERPSISLADFIADLQERVIAQAAPQVDSITLATLHAAKGLEWDAVFLAGVSEGLLPISLAATPEAREEERRLLYVGITRARDVLEISWSRSRGEGHGSSTRKRSTLLDGIWPTRGPNGGGRDVQKPPLSSSQVKRAHQNTQENWVRENGMEALKLFDALKEWRLIEANVIERPAFTILVDRTLRDIACARPKTLRQLGAIRGIGNVKLDRYGPQVLAIIRDFEATIAKKSETD